MSEQLAEPYYRVNAALLADKAPKVVVPKSCKRCMGTGSRFSYATHRQILCPDCGGTGTGTRMTT